LQALADWLVACGIDTVAMESTGVYWIPLFEMLEARGLKVYLVNSWHLKHVPGRKQAQLGPMQALVATAYKIAWTVYYMLKNRVQYHDIGAEAYEKKQQKRELAYLKEKAARLGFDLLPHDPAVAQAVALG
jgi:transposase